MTLTCLGTVALAASPELRAAVLAFFHMEEKEQIPSPSTSVPPEEPNITQADIGQLVKAKYIEMDHQYGLSGDLLNDFIWSEDGRTLLDAKFWEVKDNELIPLEVELHTEQLDVNYGGVHYQGELYWYVRNGMLYPFKGSPQGADTQPEDQWAVRAFAGRTDALLLTVTQGWQMEGRGVVRRCGPRCAGGVRWLHLVSLCQSGLDYWSSQCRVSQWPGVVV